MAKATIFEINVPDKVIEEAKKVYLENIESLPEEQQDQEKAFWDKVTKLPWGQQKQFIFARYKMDLQTPGIMKIKKTLLPAEKAAVKSMTPMDIFNLVVSTFSGEPLTVPAAAAPRAKAAGARSTAMEQIVEKGFSTDKEKK